MLWVQLPALHVYVGILVSAAGWHLARAWSSASGSGAGLLWHTVPPDDVVHGVPVDTSSRHPESRISIPVGALQCVAFNYYIQVS